VVNVVKTIDSGKLVSNQLEERMNSEDTSKAWKEWGVQLVRCKLQQISLPSEIVNATVSSVEEKRKYEVEESMIDARCKKELHNLKSEENIEAEKSRLEALKQGRRHKLELIESEHKLRLQKAEAGERLSILREKISMMKESGLDKEVLISENYAEAWSKLFSSTTQASEKIFIPTNFANFLGAQTMTQTLS
jgi:regulator of protease activity HflC (stomatin/prohibitin superfamily)